MQKSFYSCSCNISRSLELRIYNLWSYRLFNQWYVANDSRFLGCNDRSAVLLSVYRLCTEFKRLGGEKTILEQSGCLLCVRNFDILAVLLTYEVLEPLFMPFLSFLSI